MSDERLRELERRWRETGAVEDEATYLCERVRSGVVSEGAVKAAAAIGHLAARRIEGLQPQALPTRVTGLATDFFSPIAPYLRSRDVLAFALECARRVLPAWEACFPTDRRPHDATEVIATMTPGRRPDPDRFNVCARSLLRAMTDVAPIAAPVNGPENKPALAAHESAGAVYECLRVALMAATDAESHAGTAHQLHELMRPVAIARVAVGFAEADELRWMISRLQQVLLRGSRPSA